MEWSDVRHCGNYISPHACVFSVLEHLSRQILVCSCALEFTTFHDGILNPLYGNFGGD